MWWNKTTLHSEEYIGTIDNYPVNTEYHGINYGDRVRVREVFIVASEHYPEHIRKEPVAVYKDNRWVSLSLDYDNVGTWLYKQIFGETKHV